MSGYLDLIAGVGGFGCEVARCYFAHSLSSPSSVELIS
jgi:hypothetical protein